MSITSGDVVGRDKIIGYTAEQVSALLTQISATFQPQSFDGRCPYVGPDAFEEEDAARFFGRETLVAELVARVKAARFIVNLHLRRWAKGLAQRVPLRAARLADRIPR